MPTALRRRGHCPSLNIVHTRPDLSPTIFHGMVTVSAEMRALFALIRRAAQSDVTVLVRGVVLPGFLDKSVLVFKRPEQPVV